MSGSVVVLEPIPAAGLKACEPNLMPFHISYTGPALISTFMDIKPAKEDEQGIPKTQERADGATEDASTQGKDGVVEGSTVEKKEAAGTDTESSMAIDATAAVGEAGESPSESTSTRTVSTFRGRIIQGLKVDLPQGYGGLVLQAPPAHATTSASSSKPSQAESSKAASSSKSKPTVAQEDAADDDEYPTARSTRRRGRLARSAVSMKVVDVEKEEEAEKKMKEKAREAEAINVDEEPAAVAMDVDPTGQDNSSPQRCLKPVSQFSSFTIWHPDNPVVEMQDEYYRSVHEWTALAAAVRESLVPVRDLVLILGCAIG
jgi:ribonuclease H2 subunit C